MTFAPKEYQIFKKKSPKRAGPTMPMATQEKKLEELNRPVYKTSLFYFKRYKSLWNWSMATLAFDFVLVLFLPLVQKPIISAEANPIIEQILIFTLMISSIWFIKNWVLAQILGISNAKSKLFNLVERNPILILLGLAGFVSLEVFLKLGYIGVTPILLSLIIVIGALKSVKKSWKERVEKEKLLASDLASRIEAFNYTVFLSNFIPLAAARLLVIISALSFSLSAQLYPNFLITLSIGCVMLSLMQAEEKFFMVNCPKCGTKTSRFLEQNGGVCLACLKGSKF